MYRTRIALFPIILMTLYGCTASTTYTAEQPNLKLLVNDKSQILTNDGERHSYSTTSFGQYRFYASSEEGDAMYGLLPLKFNGGYLAADILFFAPAAFFNLREVFPYYHIDIKQGVVRYKKKDNGGWITYKPSAAEMERAEAYFQKHYPNHGLETKPVESSSVDEPPLNSISDNYKKDVETIGESMQCYESIDHVDTDSGGQDWLLDCGDGESLEVRCVDGTCFLRST